MYLNLAGIALREDDLSLSIRQTFRAGPVDSRYACTSNPRRVVSSMDRLFGFMTVSVIIARGSDLLSDSNNSKRCPLFDGFDADDVAG